MMKFSLEKMEGKVVHCKTEAEALELLKFLDSKGYRWMSGESLLNHTNYREYYDQTGYSVKNKKVSYSPASFYKESDYEVVEFEETEMEKKGMKKSDLKTGMRVRTRNDKMWIVIKDTLLCGVSADIIVRNSSWNNLSHYNDDLTDSFSDYDIMEVYVIESEDTFTYGFLDLNKRRSIWKREEPIKITMKDVRAKFGCDVEIVEDK